jgi:hypothetical protein
MLLLEMLRSIITLACEQIFEFKDGDEFENSWTLKTANAELAFSQRAGHLQFVDHLTSIFWLRCDYRFGVFLLLFPRSFTLCFVSSSPLFFVPSRSRHVRWAVWEDLAPVQDAAASNRLFAAGVSRPTVRTSAAWSTGWKATSTSVEKYRECTFLYS